MKFIATGESCLGLEAGGQTRTGVKNKRKGFTLLKDGEDGVLL
jgi:hypothetical protein